MNPLIFPFRIPVETKVESIALAYISGRPVVAVGGGGGGGLSCWDVVEGRPLWHIDGPVDGWDLKFMVAANNAPILTGVSSQGIFCRNVINGVSISLDEWDQESYVTLCDASAGTLADGRYFLLGAGYDGCVYRWNVSNGRAVRPLLQGHEGPLYAVRSATLADGRRVALCGLGSGTVQRWDVLTGKSLGDPLAGSFINAVHHVASVSSPSRDPLVVASDNEGVVCAWDVMGDGTVVSTVRTHEYSRNVELGTVYDSSGREINYPVYPKVTAMESFLVGDRPELFVAAVGEPLRRWDLLSGSLVGESLSKSYDVAAIARFGESIAFASADESGVVDISEAFQLETFTGR